MLQIAKKVLEKRRDIYFLVVGDGPEYSLMKQFVEQEGLNNKVLFSGARTDMACFYKDSDVTLICSIKEGLSLTAYESCAPENRTLLFKPSCSTNCFIRLYSGPSPTTRK